MQGHWLGRWGGNWVGGSTDAGNPILIAALDVGGVGSAVLIAQTIDGRPPTAIAPAGRRPRRTEPAWLHIPHTPYFPPDPEPQQTDTEDDVLMLCMH